MTQTGRLPALQIGLGLWSMRAPARQPTGWTVAYRRLRDDAVLAEELGFDSLWIAEHRFWYDGWCPQPVLAAVSAASVTERLRVGTAMHLLPQHDIERAVTTARTAADAFGSRIELGIGLGYRAQEFAGMGFDIHDRVARLRHGLDRLAAAGLTSMVRLGGAADAALRRAARSGLSVLLPPAATPADLHARIAVVRSEASARGTTVPSIGAMATVWLEDAPTADGGYRESMRKHYREYLAGWRSAMPGLRGRDLDAAVEDAVRGCVAGSAQTVVDHLRDVAAAGVDTVVLQIHTDETRTSYRDQMRALATDVLTSAREPACA